MKRVYLAARYGRRLEMVQVAADLTKCGWTVVSTWIDGHHESASTHGPRADQDASDEERATWAREDVDNLARANTTILFTESPGVEGRGRGGRHTEFGMAFGWGHRLVVVGPIENIFHCLEEVEVYPDWPTCLEALQ